MIEYLKSNDDEEPTQDNGRPENPPGKEHRNIAIVIWGPKKTGNHNQNKENVTTCSQVCIVMPSCQKPSDPRKNPEEVEPLILVG